MANCLLELMRPQAFVYFKNFFVDLKTFNAFEMENVSISFTDQIKI